MHRRGLGNRRAERTACRVLGVFFGVVLGVVSGVFFDIVLGVLGVFSGVILGIGSDRMRCLCHHGLDRWTGPLHRWDQIRRWADQRNGRLWQWSREDGRWGGGLYPWDSKG